MKDFRREFMYLSAQHADFFLQLLSARHLTFISSMETFLEAPLLWIRRGALGEAIDKGVLNYYSSNILSVNRFVDFTYEKSRKYHSDVHVGVIHNSLSKSGFDSASRRGRKKRNL